MNAKTTTPTTCCSSAHDPDQWVGEMIALLDASYEEDEDVDFTSWDAWIAAFWFQYPDGRVEPFPKHVYYLDAAGAVVGVSPGVESQYSPFFVKEGTRYSVW